MRTHKIANRFLLCWIFLTFLISSCRPLASTSVEIVVSRHENPDNWALSPKGNRIIYESGSAFLISLLSKQKYEIDACSGFNWLDNTNLYCTVGGGNPSIVVIDDMLSTGDFLRIPLTTVKVQEVDLGKILEEAGIIYKSERPSNSFLILDADYKLNPNKNYLITEVEDVNATLQEYTYITIPPLHPYIELGQNIYSPNEDYYYRLDGESDEQVLAIYDAISDDKLVEFQLEPDASEYFEFGGWAADSSGVYFRVRRRGFGEALSPRIIRKLKTP